MDPNTDINQDPLNPTNGATSFASDFDMSAINEAVAAGGDADKIQNSFDVNDIDLDNTPTTDADLQRQLREDPNMSLASSSDSSVAASPVQSATVTAAMQAPKEPAASFVDGDLVDEPVEDSAIEEEPATIADIANNTDIFMKDPINDMPEMPVAKEETKEDDKKDTEERPKEEAEKDAEPIQASVASAPVKKKSKMPIYIIIGLAVIAAAAVTIAIVVSAK